MDRYETMGRLLTDWYGLNKRDLPWRKTRDPYRIWISEIMLQQTRVDTVIDYYIRFMQRFPDAATLAEVEEGEVLSAWKGLGYYTRARNLHLASGQIAGKYAGIFPRTYDQVRALPGIGDYTAGAIMSIAYDAPYPAVDGNVLRVVARLESLEEDIAKEKTKILVAGVVRRMMPAETPGDFTQALMELGALVCIPDTPHCSQCPVRGLCAAFNEGKQEALPVKLKRQKPLPHFNLQVAIVRKDGRLLLEYRKDEKLFTRMWGLPLIEKPEYAHAEDLFYQKYGLPLVMRKQLGAVSHIFTHQIWHMAVGVYELRMDETMSGLLQQCPRAIDWVTPEDMDSLAIPTAFQKVLRLELDVQASQAP